jgi:hypothetical protein
MLGAILLVVCTTAAAHSDETFFRQYADQPNALTRRQFLVTQMAQLPAPELSFARQLLAGTDCELGLYEQALADFPFDQRQPPNVAIPRPATLPTIKLLDYNFFVDPEVVADAVPAAGYIAKAAAQRRLLLVNEAHHDAHTRELVLQLLPKLRASGYNYFAAEALIEGNASLQRRGYPITTSGTEYLHEPLYGEIIREAIRLGYILVPYDPTQVNADRDASQAATLYQRVFAHDPTARLFVLAGYAHVDKATGRLGGSTPMAMQLQRLSGVEPLSVDQTTFREIRPEPPHDVYQWVVNNYHPHQPVVLDIRGSDKPWSSDPARYDISVILPPTRGRMRPDWLALGGERHPYPIDSRLCAGTTPCEVSARYAGESDDAIAADRHAFLEAPAHSRLYLRPGRYRLLARDSQGRSLGERDITVQ